MSVMKHHKIPIIIIPGLGDWMQAYKLIAIFWRLLGYNVFIFSFGWENQSEKFDETLDHLRELIDAHAAPSIDIIGVSAGGTAAVNALNIRPKSVRRVVTIATPYVHLPHLKNTKLKDSLDTLGAISLAQFPTRILSIYGIHDKTVPIIESQPKEVQHQQVFAAKHILIIVCALTVYSTYIHRFFK